MALNKRSENSNIVYLEVKHYSLWKSLEKKVEGCDEVETTNPSTKANVTKYGYRFHDVSGIVTKLFKYDTEKKYSKRYFGFKMQMVDGADTYVIDMPYASQVLRRFLRIAQNIDWSLPITLTVFKGDKKEGGGFEETGIWFQQGGATVKSYYTREAPHGMPPAVQDPHTHEWDFRGQHRWLVDKLQTETIPLIEKIAAARVVPPAEHSQEPYNDAQEPPPNFISDDDVPF